MSRKKVLMTASVWTHIRNFHIPYLNAFRQLGWETHVACAGIPEDAPCVDKGIEVPFEKKITSPANFRAARLLRRLIRAEGYDLIIAHTTLASFFTRLAVKAMPDRPRLVNVMHGYLFDDETPALKRKILLAAERMTGPQTDLLLVMNQWDLKTARQYRLGRRIEMIPGMGVDFARLDRATEQDGRDLRASLGIPDDAFVLLYAAEFSKRKSQDVLIRAMQALPGNVVLVLCGEGATWQACRDLASKLDVSGRVLFPGMVSDMPTWYRMADASVSSSRSEGLPFNLMEAMHCGLPVVASRVKGHVDLIEDGVNGFLYPYGNEQILASRIIELMKDQKQTEEMKVRAKNGVAKYDLAEVLPVVMKYFESAQR